MTTVKERPILFSDEMVRAILDGRKTQTRRAVKDAVPPSQYHVVGGRLHWRHTPFEDSFMRCPYGVPGDRLWVREAWRAPGFLDDEPPRDIAERYTRDVVFYEADGIAENARHGAGRYRHARFMPLAFSRITLDLTAVRVQRLRDIGEEDAIAEGVTPKGFV
jgi:hypothetical protein